MIDNFLLKYPHAEFIVYYPNGNISINVYTYMAKSHLSTLKAYFNLVVKHCSIQDLEALQDKIEAAREFWMGNYGNYVEAGAIFPFAPRTSKQLGKLQQKFSKISTMLGKIMDEKLQIMDKTTPVHISHRHGIYEF